MFCSKCGNQLNEGENFCPNCGASISVNNNGFNNQDGENYVVQTVKMSMDNAIKGYWLNYVNFNGRARRKEYWYVFLFNFIIAGFVLPIFKNTGIFYTIISGLWSLATLLPSLSLCVRRLHDIGKNGLFLLFALIPIVGAIMLIIWYCKDGSPYDNQYGASTKYVASYREEVNADAII